MVKLIRFYEDYRMLRRWRIRGWMLVLALNLALAAAVGFSFVRPIGVAYRSNYTYPEQRFPDGTGYAELSIVCFDGAAFHEGGLVVFRFMSDYDPYKTSGFRIVRIDHENMRSHIYCTMNPIDGYSTTRLGVQVGVDHPLGGTLKILVIPCWLVLLVLGMPLGRRLYGLVAKSRRVRKGFCGSCGYDMRASGSRCPECGRASEQVGSGAGE